MKRLAVALSAFALFIAGCTGSAGTSGSPAVSIAVPSNLASHAIAGASAAIDQLCDDQDPASLSMVAAELDKVDSSTTDTSAIEARLATLKTNLDNAEVGATATPLRQAAVTAVTQLRTAIKDPNTREQSAKAAADTLRKLDDTACK